MKSNNYTTVAVRIISEAVMMNDTEKRAHSFSINGHSYQALVADNNTLLEIIRYELDLIGTKQGCDKGDCGACTVLVNGRPILSCLGLAKSFDTHDAITTIEGLATGKEPDLMLRAFEKAGALQCGFCQPGMILSARALLNRIQRPTILEIKQALSGNLCRCTGYTKIYMAVLLASLVESGEAHDLDRALVILRDARTHLGDA